MRFETRVNQRVPDVNFGDRTSHRCRRVELHADKTMVTIVRGVRRVNGGWRERRGVERFSFLQRQFAAATFAEMTWSNRFDHTFVTAHKTSRGAFASQPEG